MSLSESLPSPMHSAEKESVLNALRSSGTPVRPAEVSKQTGISVPRVTYWLNKIASETGGHLVVDTASSVAYQFRPGFEIAYLFKGIRTFLRRGGADCTECDNARHPFLLPCHVFATTPAAFRLSNVVCMELPSGSGWGHNGCSSCSCCDSLAGG